MRSLLRFDTSVGFSLSHKMTFPKVLICGKPLSTHFVLLITTSAGKIVWGDKDVEEMLGSIAEIVVRCSMIPILRLVLITGIADGFALPSRFLRRPRS